MTSNLHYKLVIPRGENYFSIRDVPAMLAKVRYPDNNKDNELSRLMKLMPNQSHPSPLSKDDWSYLNSIWQGLPPDYQFSQYLDVFNNATNRADWELIPEWTNHNLNQRIFRLNDEDRINLELKRKIKNNSIETEIDGVNLRLKEFREFATAYDVDVIIEDSQSAQAESASNSANQHPDSQNILEKTLGRRDSQINLIIEIAQRLSYELLAIPEGGKQAIKAECLKNTSLFTDSGFDHAWSEANSRNTIRMKDKEKYL